MNCDILLNILNTLLKFAYFLYQYDGIGILMFKGSTTISRRHYDGKIDEDYMILYQIISDNEVKSSFKDEETEVQ